MRIEEAIEILKLITPFTAEEAKKAYRKLVLKTHPDKGGSVDQFIKVKQAYEICKNGFTSQNDFKVYWDVGTRTQTVYSAPDINNDGLKDIFNRYQNVKKKASIQTKINRIIIWFTKKIREKLYRKIGEKGTTWQNEKISSLFRKLATEILELSEALQDGGKDKIIDECVDVAAFAMFIADNVNRK